VDGTAFPQRLVEVVRRVDARSPVQAVADALAATVARLVPAGHVVVAVPSGGRWDRAVTAAAGPGAAAPWTGTLAVDAPAVRAARDGRTLRLAPAELDAHLVAEGLPPAPEHVPPLRGLLVVPVHGTGGEPVALVQLTDRSGGPFTTADEEAVTALGALAAGAVEAAWVVEETARSTRALQEALGTSDVLAAAVDRLLDGVSVLEPVSDETGAIVDMRYAFVNPEGERLLGVRELTGRRVLEAIPSIEGSGVMERFLSILASGEPAEYEDRYEMRGRTLWYQATVVPTAGRLVILFRDISERRALQDRLLEAQKMEVVGRLAGGVAHDFNNLLTVVLGHAELASTELASGDDPSAHVDDILAAAQRGAALTRRLLAFSRRQVLRPEVVAVGDVVAKAAPVLRRLVSGDVRLVLRPDRSRHRVFVDPGQLEQVLFNLVVNACDAMPGGGTLTVETFDEEVVVAVDDDDGSLPSRSGPHAVLQVTDTGTGMDDAVLHRALEPFFTTKPPGEGAGLGLSTVYGIVRQHGGHVQLRTAVGLGTTAVVRLPAAEDPDLVGLAAGGAAGGDEAVLVVEGDDPVRALAIHVLSRAGYAVTGAGDAAEAEQVLGARPDAVDLVVAEEAAAVGSPLAAALADRGARVLVLAVSGAGTRDLASPYVLAKPFTPRELLGAVRAALDGGAG
jgi:signal transduction histidine kinase